MSLLARPAPWRARHLTALLLLLAGCAGGARLGAVTVLQHDQCRGLDAGLTRVDYRALAGIRSTTLLSMKRPAPEAGAGLLLIALSRGQQPTPGYALNLVRATRRDQTAVIEVAWETPPSGTVLAQMITHPCLVVGLPAADFNRIEARDQRGNSLGSLAL